MNLEVKLAVLGAACAVLACKARREGGSDVKITNGVVIADAYADDPYPAVVSLASTAAGLCTGTFVSSSTLITAAHCVDRSEGGGLAFGEARPTAVFTGNLVGKLAALRKSDVAIAVFPAGTAPTETTFGLLARAVAKDDPVTVIGFGRSDVNDSTTSGLKRVGWNVVKDRPGDGFVHVTGLAATDATKTAGTEAATSPGDSGSPLLIDGAVAAVCSGGGVLPDGTKRSLFVDLGTKESCTLLAKAVAGGAEIAGYDAAACVR